MRRFLGSVAVAASVALTVTACAADDPAGLLAAGGYCPPSTVLEVDAPAMAQPAMDETAMDETAMTDEMAADGETHTHEHSHDAAERADVAFVVTMQEFQYGCVLPAIAPGTTVALHFRNVGTTTHEAVVGDLAAQDDAERMMTAMAAEGDGGHMAHGAHGTSVVVEPGDEGSVLFTVESTDELLVGCHFPGHWQAGMQLPIALAT